MRVFFLLLLLFLNTAASSCMYSSVSFPSGIFPRSGASNEKKLLLGGGSNVTFRLFLKPDFSLSGLIVNVTGLSMPVSLEFLVFFKV